MNVHGEERLRHMRARIAPSNDACQVHAEADAVASLVCWHRPIGLRPEGLRHAVVPRLHGGLSHRGARGGNS
eukprot:CAMPEP_0174884208 /NCGR_PEP_ID=MMETSP1114-20130205/85652_1 /TAXON_ID=312471 /ORGANISM="Neobodo designis, Strain CCAP 1951/1" /LENGTH=71 /DNA_ID=CAMNT_0016119611 /DNA_START=824 /DNA_END=1036 /DNA_ORIENTATION=+